jgi:hypothetical protein
MSRDWTKQSSNQQSSEPDAQPSLGVPGKSTRVEALQEPVGPVQAKASGGAPAPAPAPAPSPEATEVQLKSMEIWLKAFAGGTPEEGAGSAESLAPTGAGSPMPAPVQAKMEQAFGTDLSAVRVHEGPQAEAMGAAAYTQGTNIHFAPGQYNPDSQSGQELLGHELTHVVQQSQGRVAGGAQGKGGVTINSDAGLEQEADEHGAKAARGERVGGGGGAGGAAAEGGAQGSEPSTQDYAQMYPPGEFSPVPLAAFASSVIQPAYIARRPLSGMRWMIGPAYHEHIFFEDGGNPANIGHMGPQGLGQDAATNYTQTRTGLDDALMRQAVAAVDNPGAYRLIGNNCQDYVRLVLAQYQRLQAAQQQQQQQGQQGQQRQ